MFYFFDCGDLWVRQNVNLQDDIERCFDVILPSISTLDENVIKYFVKNEVYGSLLKSN